MTDGQLLVFNYITPWLKEIATLLNRFFIKSVLVFTWIPLKMSVPIVQLGILALKLLCYWLQPFWIGIISEGTPVSSENIEMVIKISGLSKPPKSKPSHFDYEILYIFLSVPSVCFSTAQSKIQDLEDLARLGTLCKTLVWKGIVQIWQSQLLFRILQAGKSFFSLFLPTFCLLPL